MSPCHCITHVTNYSIYSLASLNANRMSNYMEACIIDVFSQRFRPIYFVYISFFDLRRQKHR